MVQTFAPWWQNFRSAASWVWQQLARHWRIAGIAILLALFSVIVLGYWLKWQWTGVVSETNEPKQPVKTLWDWLQLLLVPVLLAIGGFWLNQIQKGREEKIAKDRYDNDVQITRQRYEQDQQFALDKQREDLLQAYLDCMSNLLQKEKLLSSKNGDEVNKVARLRTISVLLRLDSGRVSFVFTFLREAELMRSISEAEYAFMNSHGYGDIPPEVEEIDVFSFKDANFRRVNWSKADREMAHLSGADLREANLSGANLEHASLRGTNLERADLSGAILSVADLNADRIKMYSGYSFDAPTNLKEANLRCAILGMSDLSDTDLSRADLRGAYFGYANLKGAKLKEARYNTKKCILRDSEGRILEELPPTQWSEDRQPQDEIDPNTAGAIEDNSDIVLR